MLHPYLRSGERSAANDSRRAPEGRLAEAVGLARAIDLDIAGAQLVPLAELRPATLIGKGSLETIRESIEALEIKLVVVDAPVTPVQQRNLEKAWACKVIDRTGLILEIFGARARTHEGRLQVELAALTYQRSRLVRSWTHLERQRGGFGFLGGPGESQLELDRRLIGDRITRLKRELEEVKRTRLLHRKARQRVPYPIVALVGYTNAGKSTLFNRLTNSTVFAKDLLFATLDPTMRTLVLPSGQHIILSDTVGFISDLPTHLVASFRATLEEVLEADIVVHVRDIAHPDSLAQKGDVEAVLRSLGLDALFEDERGDALIEVLNKIDLIEPEARHALIQGPRDAQSRVALSAVTGDGCATLLALLDDKLSRGNRAVTLVVPLSDGAAIAWLYQHGRVIRRTDDEAQATMLVVLQPADLDRFAARDGRVEGGPDAARAFGTWQ